MWIHTETGKIFTLHSEIRIDQPGVSFPEVITDEMLARFGYVPIETPPSKQAS